MDSGFGSVECSVELSNGCREKSFFVCSFSPVSIVLSVKGYKMYLFQEYINRNGEYMSQQSAYTDSQLDTIEKYSDMVYRLAYSMMKSRQDADDVHQDVFVKFLYFCPQFASKEHEKAWFIRVTVNCCKNYYKTAWRRHVVSLADCGAYEEPAALNGQAGSQPEEEALIETVKRLPEKYWAVIHLFYYEDLSVEDIAKVLGRKKSTVRTQLVRARRLLEKWLSEEVE